MSDPALLWNAPPPPRRKPTPGEYQWTLLKEGRRFTCELRCHGEYGWEAQFFINEELFCGHRFELKAQALQWAGLEKKERVRDGWETA